MNRLLQAVVAVVLAVLVAGCGEGELPAQRGLPADTVLVTQRQVSAYPARSPERTFMSWWRALQYTDSPTYLDLVSRTLRRDLRRTRSYRQQLPIVARQVSSAYPHITRVAAAEDQATLYTEIEFRSLVGSDRFSSVRIPQAFPMLRERGAWRMADDLFVEAAAQPELARRLKDAGGPSTPPTQTVTVTTPQTVAPAPTGLPQLENRTPVEQP